MLAQAPDWQNKFSSGFAAPGIPASADAIWAFLGIVAVLALAAWGYQQFRSYRRRNAAEDPVGAVVESRSPAKHPKYVAVPGRLNPLQQKIIQDLINDFRKQEISAQAIPSNVLEKYSEFFFNNLAKLDTDEKEVEEFVDVNYPLQTGFEVELDLHTSGTLHLVKTKVLAVDNKSVTVEFRGVIPDYVRKGAKVTINYSQGKHFLQGATVVNDLYPGQGVVLRRPTHVNLGSERRYSRVALKKATGSLHDTKSAFQIGVRVLDVSLEGVRIQVGRPLDKTHVFQLVFEATDGVKTWNFGPIECVPSKAFLTGSGTFETGLVFLYVNLETKTELWAMMKQLAQAATTDAAAVDK